MPDPQRELRSLLTAVTEVEVALRGEPDVEQAPYVGGRLRHSVVRPLRQAVGLPSGGDAETGDGQPPSDGSADVEAGASGSLQRLGDRLWELARTATGLRVRLSDLPELAEATAALQDLAIALVDESSAAARLGELAALQSGLNPEIQLAHNGPYLVTNAPNLYDGLGRALPVRPQMALCRCGGSQIKPFCDGTHARIGFTDAKNPDRVRDRRDTYVGQQVTVLDNRGICQHSGLCTDRLNTVFHQRGEPFVTPSGGRMDEIIRAVRDCPSGAISYAVDGEEARDVVDHHGRRAPTIEVTADGPYRVVGGIPLVDSRGVDVTRNEGASREHYALCRCGQSQNKPFCSGMHYYVQFRDPVPAADHQPTIFEWAGGLPALTRMTRLFYEKHVPQDPVLAPLFATMSADHPERVAKWLGEVFCGPKWYSAEYGGYPRMISQHLGKGLTEEQRTHWVALLLQSAREAGLPNDAEFRSAFGAYIEWGSRLAVENSQTGARPPERMPMPHWDWHTAAGPPGSRISALAPPDQEEEQQVVFPAADEPVSFGKHIRPLFRPTDKQSMSFVFDLWSYDDVSRHADAILDRLRAGTMPCDGAWPEARIDVVQRWVDTGKAP
jgi:CDGSH-type Zn-finger protein/truncated hemoglobin YjbI